MRDREASTIRERLSRVPQVGRVAWIGVRPEHGAPMRVLEEAIAIAGRGLEGDRIVLGPGGGKRQVTLIQAEHLDVIARLIGRGASGEAIAPALVRRNLVIAGINLRALERMRFAIGRGGVVLEGTGPCEPCAKMDEALGEGAFQAMRGHGGITARVVVGGPIALGDEVRALARTDA